MTYPVNLVDIATGAIAAGCVRAVMVDLSPRPRKLWRIGLPPLLAIAVSLLLLAGDVVGLENDLAWLGAAGAGAAIGWLRGRGIAVQTDQRWGKLALPVTHDGLVAAFALFAIALTDGLSGLLPAGMLPRPAYLAATSGLFAGFLVGRAWSLAKRAVEAPHTELGDD